MQGTNPDAKYPFSAGSPNAFGSFSSIKIKAAEGDAGASRSFGTVTHTWVHVVMGG